VPQAIDGRKRRHHRNLLDPEFLELTECSQRLLVGDLSTE
jgi:hypothetical protein